MYPFDLRSLAIVGGAPEHVIMQRDGYLLARCYDPGARFGYLATTQARYPGLQAGLEKAFGAGYAVALGCRELLGAGMLGFDDIFSPEQFLADRELRDALQRLAAPEPGVPAGRWQMVIGEGLEGGYAPADATVDRLDDVYHFPRLLDRSTLYGRAGRPAEAAVREEALTLIQRPAWTPPEPEIGRVREIWHRAWHELVGGNPPGLANDGRTA